MKMTKPLIELFTLQSIIHRFFNDRGFLHVLTPPAVENPGMETHIHPFQLYSAHRKEVDNLYLHTSPEFHMKNLLSLGHEKIFTLSYCFRDEPSSSTHRPQFLMLEWYRANERYEKIMDDVISLIEHSHHELKKSQFNVKPLRAIRKITVTEIFHEVLGVDILNYQTRNELYQLIKNNFCDIHLGTIEDYQWEDLYFLLFLNKIESELKSFGNILLYEFPSQLAALSTLKKENSKVCERFEVYIDGIEICNCFNELTDLKEQKKRFKSQSTDKNNLYNYNIGEPQKFYETLKRGLPPSSGIALGVERLLMSLCDCDQVFFD